MNDLRHQESEIDAIVIKIIDSVKYRSAFHQIPVPGHANSANSLLSAVNLFLHRCDPAMTSLHPRRATMWVLNQDLRPAPKETQ
jgi:hypothetical protein